MLREHCKHKYFFLSSSSEGWRVFSLLSHSSDINDLLEGLDGVFKDWLDGLHDTESSFHIVNLWLHSFDGFHLSGNFNEWLSIIESLEDSGSECFLDVLDGSGLGNGGIGVSSGFWSLSRWEVWWELSEEFIFIHLFEVDGSDWCNEGGSNEFHFFSLLSNINYKNKINKPFYYL